MAISSAERDRDAIAEMHRIHDAIRARDPDAAHAAALEHVQVAARIARQHLDTGTDDA